MAEQRSEERSASERRIRAIQTRREWSMRRLVRKGRLGIEDIQALDRIGRFRVALSHWSLCDSVARHALLNDGHHHVRSAAAISSRKTVA